MKNFIGNNINAIRVHFGLSQEQFAEMADVTQQTVSYWETGQSTPRKRNVLRLMERLPGITFDDVMSEDSGFAVRVLNEPIKPYDAWVEVPLFGSIAAGKPISMDAVDNSFVIPYQLKERYPEAFLLKVEGESMNRKLPNGSYALINPDCQVIDGNAYAVCINGYDATVKRVNKLENGFELVPDSTDPFYAPRVYDYDVEGTETITVIGEVVWCVFPFDYDF